MSTGRARKVAGFAFALLYSLTVFFVFGEVATRSLGLLDRLTGVPRHLYMAVDDEDLPYRLTPGTVIEGPPHSVRVNSLGLRGPETATDPADGVERILVLGDSIVFGQGVGDDETFPARLSAELHARGRRAAEVVNGGVPGYNTAAELVFLRDYGLRLRPRAVVLGISLNDFGDTPVVSQEGVLTQDRSRRMDPGRWRPRSEFLSLAGWLVKYGRSEHWFQRGARQTGAKELLESAEKFIANQHRRFYENPKGPGWQRVHRSLAQLRDLCADRGIDLWVVLFPEGYQRSTDDLRPQREWLNLCSTLGLRCVDLWASFAAAGGNLFAGVQHPNAAGHAVAARTVADLLAEHGGAPIAKDVVGGPVAPTATAGF
jgi:lysophospholipase L1-like esterase